MFAWNLLIAFCSLGWCTPPSCGENSIPNVSRGTVIDFARDRPTNSMARSDHESPRLFQSILQSPLIHIAQINRGPHTNVPRGTFRRRLGSTLEAAVKRKSHVGATQIPRAPTNFEQRWNGPTRSTIR